jgi:hypothetical protein
LNCKSCTTLSGFGNSISALATRESVTLAFGSTGPDFHPYSRKAELSNQTDCTLWKARLLIVSIVLSVMLFPISGMAAESTSTQVTPLGFAIGEAKRKTITETLAGKSDLKSDGINYYSQGPMLTIPGKGLGIEGLLDVRFIFDRHDTLVGVVMTLDKEFDQGFDKTYRRLAAKYHVVKKSVPFVGNKSARFEAGNTVIELEAPHLSFTMSLAYMTREFESGYRYKLRRDQKNREQREAQQF